MVTLQDFIHRLKSQNHLVGILVQRNKQHHGKVLIGKVYETNKENLYVESCYSVSSYFGFGLMDAAVLVNYSRPWRTVPEQIKCEATDPKVYRYVGLLCCVVSAFVNASLPPELSPSFPLGSQMT